MIAKIEGNSSLQGTGSWCIGKSMTALGIRHLLRGSVFRPFTVHAEGKSFHVLHPEFAALTGPGKTLILLHKEDNAFDLVDVEVIARVEVHEAKGRG